MELIKEEKVITKTTHEFVDVETTVIVKTVRYFNSKELSDWSKKFFLENCSAAEFHPGDIKTFWRISTFNGIKIDTLHIFFEKEKLQLMIDFLNKKDD